MIGKNALEIKNLSFQYNKNSSKILNDINLKIPQGRITTIIGPNGCGKTTLLRLISGLNDTTSGEVYIQGKNIKAYTRNELAQTVSILPQSRDIADITVEKLVEHGRFPYLGVTRNLRDKDKSVVENAMKVTKVYGFREKLLNTLSGGERQRAYISMTLAQDTPIMFMDEPTTYLDVEHQFDLLNLVKLLNKKYNKTIILILHDLSLALKYSDNLVVLNEGAVKYCGTSDCLVKENSKVFEDVFHVQCKEMIIEEEKQYIVFSQSGYSGF